MRADEKVLRNQIGDAYDVDDACCSGKLVLWGNAVFAAKSKLMHGFFHSSIFGCDFPYSHPSNKKEKIRSFSHEINMTYSFRLHSAHHDVIAPTPGNELFNPQLRCTHFRKFSSACRDHLFLLKSVHQFQRLFYVDTWTYVLNEFVFNESFFQQFLSAISNRNSFIDHPRLYSYLSKSGPKKLNFNVLQNIKSKLYAIVHIVVN